MTPDERAEACVKAILEDRHDAYAVADLPLMVGIKLTTMDAELADDPDSLELRARLRAVLLLLTRNVDLSASMDEIITLARLEGPIDSANPSSNNQTPLGSVLSGLGQGRSKPAPAPTPPPATSQAQPDPASADPADGKKVRYQKTSRRR